jgi:hypothetical protein
MTAARPPQCGELGDQDIEATDPIANCAHEVHHGAGHVTDDTVRQRLHREISLRRVRRIVRVATGMRLLLACRLRLVKRSHYSPA